MACLDNGGFVMARDPKYMTFLTKGIYLLKCQLAKHIPQGTSMQENLRACQAEKETSEQALKARVLQITEEVRSFANDADACIPCSCLSAMSMLWSQMSTIIIANLLITMCPRSVMNIRNPSGRAYNAEQDCRFPL